MQVPVRVTFRNIGRSPGIVLLAHRHAERLARLVGRRFHECHVTLDRPGRAFEGFRVRVDSFIPRGGVVASRVSATTHTFADAYVALGAAFEAVREQVVSLHERRRDTKRAA